VSLPTVPPLSLSQVRTEFGAPSNVQLTALVRGGAYVAINTPDSTGNPIPTAPPITLTDFLGSRHIAGLTVLGAAISGFYSISSVTPNGDCSSIVCVLAGSVSSAGNANNSGLFQLQLGVLLVPDLASVTVSLPPSQPINGGGYYQMYGATQFKSTVTPAGGLTPNIVTPTDNSEPYYSDVVGPFTGEFHIEHASIMAPTRTNPEIGVPLVGMQFNLMFPLSHNLFSAGGSPPKSWETRATGQNTFIEFPIRIGFYDVQGFNSYFTTTIRIEADSTVGVI
jgi:hypothetical protein